MPQLGITQGAQPVISYNAGSGHLLRVDSARVLSLRATVVYRACAAALVAGFAQPLAGFFLSDPGAVELAAGGLRIIAVGFLFSGVTPLVSGYFQALGRSTPAYALSLGTLLAIRLPLVLGLGGLGPAGVWGALALGEAASALVAWLVLRAATRTRPAACRP
ncbi:MATE family efflux transporter [Tessaracoccus lacteus]|uniref:MATE family efflux transporter n=1 Tax=Tessaracoccus lacteus TaxID=3041766 RepID=A0ABY8Q0Q4_9ACTN|nr:MATE family efflux transporter [Tessaracoccus sp. T21]WGT48344.1 MATE family efflux transporter [Tessaracoccus sp. T21]